MAELRQPMSRSLEQRLRKLEWRVPTVESPRKPAVPDWLQELLEASGWQFDREGQIVSPGPRRIVSERQAGRCVDGGERGPVWRVGRDHLCGYAMDSRHVTRSPGFWLGCPAATEPLSRDHRKFSYHLRSASLSQGKSSRSS